MKILKNIKIYIFYQNNFPKNNNSKLIYQAINDFNLKKKKTNKHHAIKKNFFYIFFRNKKYIITYYAIFLFIYFIYIYIFRHIK